MSLSVGQPGFSGPGAEIHCLTASGWPIDGKWTTELGHALIHGGHASAIVVRVVGLFVIFASLFDNSTSVYSGNVFPSRHGVGSKV